jgi:hypothetical protein
MASGIHGTTTLDMMQKIKSTLVCAVKTETSIGIISEWLSCSDSNLFSFLKNIFL